MTLSNAPEETTVPRARTGEELRQANLDVFREAPIPADLELKQVILVHRHGERTPVHYNTSGHLTKGIWNQCSLKPFIHALHTVLLPDNPGPHPPSNADPPGINTFRFIQGVKSDQPLESDWSRRMLGNHDSDLCEPGQLTDVGKMNLIRLGNALRSEYITRFGFLPPHLTAHVLEEDLYVRSTGYVRTIESVQYLLAGLFPLETREPGKAGDIPIHIRAVGNMFPTVDSCPRLGEMLREFRRATVQTPTHLRAAASLTSRAQNYLYRRKKAEDPTPTSSTGSTPVVDFGELLHAYDLAACHLGGGRGLPHDVDPELFRDLEEYVTSYWWDVFAVPSGVAMPETTQDAVKGVGGKEWGREMKALAIGRFVGDLKEMMTAAVKGAGKGWWNEREETAEVPKLAIFSGHDTTVGPLLAALNGYGGPTRHVPDFRANLAFELYHRPAATTAPGSWTSWIASAWTPAAAAGPAHFVRLRYNGEPLALPQCAGKGKHLDGDKTLCTFEAFRKSMEEVVPRDWEGECRPRVPQESKDGK
ncbi:hypothetical protein HDU96_007242 [Phlyctochytrium bullatum]|nr:hypothetical protein HDU96_007242 [Phlyctochytrium bullatum]